MTIPTLITKHQKMIIEKRITQDFSIIQQVIRMQLADGLNMTDGIKDDDTEYLKSWFEKYFIPYMKIVKVCYDSAGCWQNKGPTRRLDGVTVSNSATGIGDNTVSVVLPNGSYICFDGYTSPVTIKKYFGISSSGGGALAIYADANGNTPPNTIGKDIYLFVYAPDVGLVPAGTHETREIIDANCSNASTGYNAGYFCLAKIKMDSWKILDEVWDR